MKAARWLFLLLLLSGICFGALTSPKSTVVFVENDMELNAALELAAHDKLESLAVSQDFYLGTAKQTKARIRGLMEMVKERPYARLYFYAKHPIGSLVAELIDADTEECKFGGGIHRYRLSPSSQSIAVRHFCVGSGIQKYSDEAIHEDIMNIDRDVH